MFNHEGNYKCACGREFTNSQSFNAHKLHCEKHHLNKYGNLDNLLAYRDKLININKQINDEKRKELEEQKRIKREKFLENWISEQHKCERCGKVMTEYYGSGRFCSRACSNARNHSEEERKKISISLLKTHNNNLSDSELENIYLNNKQNILVKKERLIKEKELENLAKNIKLPVISEEKKKQGYPIRTILSYPEKFWKAVLDNNNIKYEHNVSVWKPGYNNYWLDFLIDNNIDLEIDGSLHEKQDIRKKDKVRDNWIEKCGYKIYRIKWVNPISIKNKIIVNKQIDDLFKFLNKDRIN